MEHSRALEGRILSSFDCGVSRRRPRANAFAVALPPVRPTPDIAQTQQTRQCIHLLSCRGSSWNRLKHGDQLVERSLECDCFLRGITYGRAQAFGHASTTRLEFGSGLREADLDHTLVGSVARSRNIANVLQSLEQGREGVRVQQRTFADARYRTRRVLPQDQQHDVWG